MFSTRRFLVIPVFSQKKTSVTGQQQLALWLPTDLLFSLFRGAQVTPFWWVLLFQNSAFISSTMWDSHADLDYTRISFAISGLDTAHGHLRTKHSHSFFTPFRNTSNQNASKNLAHCSTQNTINSKHPSQQSIISTYHYLQLQKILPDRFPVTHSV